MANHHLESMIRSAAATATLRRSAAALGAAALVAALAPSRGLAGNDKKRKGRRRADKRADRTCKRHIGQCRAVIAAVCQDDPDPESCDDNFLPCCDRLRNCAAGTALDCLFGAVG